MRELENIIERAVIMEKGDTIRRIDLGPAGSGGRFSLPFQTLADIEPFRKMKTEFVERFEREYLSGLLRMYRGNISKSARHAGINIKNFHEKMARYGLKKEEFKEDKMHHSKS